jgi:hypothetical protein
MNPMLSRAARAAAALAAAAAVAAAAPAAASAPPVNESYALDASGPVTVQQAGAAVYTQGSPVVLPNVDAAGLLRTGVVTDRVGAASAASRVPAVVLTLPGHATLRARAVSSSCRYTARSGAVSATARITGGVVRAGRRVIRLPAVTVPNTRIVLPGSAVLLVNRQFTGPGGTLTVAALRIRMLRGGQKLLLATSVCAAATLGPAAAVSGPVVRLIAGALLLLVLGGLAWGLSRRRQRTGDWSPPAAGTEAGRTHAGTGASGG